jgi:transposase-like protein
MSNRVDIIRKLQTGQLRVSKAARILGVSRQTLYSWLEKIQGTKDISVISQQLRRKKREVWASNQCSVMIERKILSVTKSYPEQTLAYIYKKVSRQLGSKQISWHGFYNCLKRNNLLSKTEREKFSKSTSSVPDLYREQMVRKVLVGHYPVAKVAREYQLSRQQVHQWLKRYQTGGVANLKNRVSLGRGGLQANENQISQVLAGVVAKPDFSYKELALYLKECDPGFGIGAHGVYNILKRYNLGVISDRRYYAGKFGNAAETPVSSRNGEAPVISGVENLSPNLLPAPPPVDFKQSALLYLNPPVLPQPAPIKSPQFGLTLTFTSIASFITFSALFNLVDTFATATSAMDALGRGFALLALTMGSLFLLYSMKYYVTVALVLIFSRKINQVDSTAKDLLNLDFSGSQDNLLTSQTSIGKRTGLLPNLSAIELERHPFVSIHIPLFNEKRVVNRLLEAVTSMEYDNYEVVVCDDSTDETKDIVEEWRNPSPRQNFPPRDSCRI